MTHTPQSVVVCLALLCSSFASVALADDFKTINGKEYKNAEVSRIEPDGLVLKTKSGISKLYFVELPPEVQRRFNYEPQQASAYSATQAANYATNGSRCNHNRAVLRKHVQRVANIVEKTLPHVEAMKPGRNP